MPVSSLYVGRVRHRRMGAPEHSFTYPVWYLWLDLDELGALDRDLGFFAHNSLNLTGLR